MRDTHPFNKLKFCPKCGSKEFHKSGEKSLKCEACNFHFFFNSAAAVGVLVVDDEGKLMLVKRGVEPGYGKLDLPGGFVDPLETAENAVRRELWEELGMKIKSMKYLGSAPNEYVFSDYSVFTLDMAFIVVPESVEGLKPMDDIISFKFYAEEELNLNDILAPSIRNFVKNYFKNEYNSKPC
jgi:NAD+ diphosphatase